ncbi:Por secretion system C-terminal sorting domain-containing protein [Chryseobacterium sp. RU37D]|uniref:zinc-dependent metalloprotease n=1 Tax=Chryseobacterium sp. RU37D TaxID=1907397 RepID=UPI00095480A3|nr:zinc-dependent metalloprotease [Chryseobacterium sp. RU37D]SIP99891.1 Por secretion system C-terminal sorting domain-containing protein [Chryseobacterium sp. RU37D]
MDKKLFLFALMIFINTFAQNTQKYCGFDEQMRKIDSKHPDLTKSRAETDLIFSNMDKHAFLNKIGASSSWNGLYTGQIYEIPVVVHVIQSSAAANANLTVTDQEIIDWIDRANKMYATTYGGGFYPEGSGPTGGNIIPFKLVLAKRSPSCTPTTGILRYNGSTLSGYDSYGVRMNGSNGVRDYVIKNQLAPHWPETSYFNIYVVIGFDGQQQLSYGLMGYAAFPDTYDYGYESFMKVATIKNLNDTTLTHELGHSFGLLHTFQGVSYTDQTTCPVNNNCSTDGDRVCDTSPSRSMYGIYPVPSNSATDPCTGTNYDGTQYNIMNYTNDNKKFTAGQRDRAVLMMMEYRKNLLNSLAAKDPSVSIPSPVNVIAAQCNPAGTLHPTNNNFAIGPYRVQMASISSITNGYDSDEAAPVYYADYSQATCIRPAYYTDIQANSSTPIGITFLNGFNDPNQFRTKVWIDYNNNGAFEASELVINNTSLMLPSGNTTTLTDYITPPAGAVKNTYLRMRVAVDAATYNSAQLPDFDACSQLQYGQMEDYAVRIMDVLGTSDVKDNAEAKIVFMKAENKLKLAGSKKEIFGDYHIYDMSGKLIQKGNSMTNEIQINQSLPKGTYILNHSGSGKKESKKFINN